MLVDTSVWIEFFRKKEPYYKVVLDLIDSEKVVCIGIVLAELLQGAKSVRELNTIKEFLYVFDFLPESERLWEQAGELSFNLHRKGKSVGLSDCYITAVTKAYNIKLLTTDKHFDVIRKEVDINYFGVKG
ncbi:MAG: type II toxin-antitoxin system VapC family toxin [Nitrospirota bacterium]